MDNSNNDDLSAMLATIVSETWEHIAKSAGPGRATMIIVRQMRILRYMYDKSFQEMLASDIQDFIEPKEKNDD